MANELLVSSVTDLFASEVVAPEFLMTLAERDGSVLFHPAFLHKTGAPGSNVVKVPHLGIGADIMTPHTPNNESGNTAFGMGHTDVTIATRDMVRSTSDLARYVSMGRLGPATWALDLAITYAQTVINLAANIADDFTGTAGPGTGVNLTWADILNAKGQLAVNKARGPLLCLLHPQQWADLEADALALGEIPAAAGTASAINQGMDSYKGNYFGIDFFTSSHVPTANAGADRAGALLTAGAMAWADAQLEDEGDPNIMNLGRARLERDRKAKRHGTDYVLSAVLGASKALDGAGITIISDA